MKYGEVYRVTDEQSDDVVVMIVAMDQIDLGDGWFDNRWVHAIRLTDGASVGIRVIYHNWELLE